MPKLIFVGSADPTEADECETYGTVFPRGEAVSVSAEVFELLSTNQTFKVAPRVGRPTKS
jgi:hypothetical protein